MKKIKQISVTVLVYGGIFAVVEMVCRFIHSSTSNKVLASTIMGTACGCQIANVLMKKERYTDMSEPERNKK
jgi:hypothetical protein